MGVVRRKLPKISDKYEVREGIMYVPDPLAPSGFREYCVTQAAWNKRRMALAERAGNRCQHCYRWTPFPTGDGAHIKATGAGGDDSMGNLKWMCRRSHTASHNPRAVPRRPKGEENVHRNDCQA